jgi:hypothetical protein
MINLKSLNQSFQPCSICKWLADCKTNKINEIRLCTTITNNVDEVGLDGVARQAVMSSRRLPNLGVAGAFGTRQCG